MKQEWTHCYRMRPYFRNVGLAGTVCSLAMTILFFVALWIQPANHPVNAPFLIAISLLFTALGIYLLLLHHRYRLFVSDSAIHQTGVVRSKTADLRVIGELKWRFYPLGGSVRLSGMCGVLSIDALSIDALSIELGNFNQQDRQQLISFLRGAIAESKQVGWQQFSEQFADTPKKRTLSIRAQLIFAAIFAAHVVAFGLIWWLGGGSQFLLFSAGNALVTVYLLRSYCRKRAEIGNNTE